MGTEKTSTAAGQAALQTRVRAFRTGPTAFAARAVLVTTGVHAAVWFLSCAWYVVTGEPSSETPFVLLALTGPLSWMMLSEWTCRVAAIRRLERVTVPHDAWIWLAWLVPVANLFAPATTMRRLSGARVDSALLLAWWLPWLLATGLSLQTHDARTVGSLALEGAAILVSWLALQRIIRQIDRGLPR